MGTNTIVNPKVILTIDEFIALLDQKNKAICYVREAFNSYRESVIRIYKKDSSTYDIIMGGRHQSRFPIVDKALQMVIEADGCHQQLVGSLFAYHYVGKGKDPTLWDDRIWWDLYCQHGYCYYFTGAFGKNFIAIISEGNYKPDKYDKDIFIGLGIGVY